MITALAACVLLCATLPAIMMTSNLWQFRRPASPARGERPGVSVLIPARNEASVIEPTVEAVLGSEGVDLELIVLDDGSEDDTAARVRRLAERDDRVKLAGAPPLPAGWCGKQHACHVLATMASRPVLVFLDADVRVTPMAIASGVAELRARDAKLVSGFPFQQTGSFGERLLLPLIHFVLLGFLPVRWMRQSLSPAYGAGCGQWFIADRDAYHQAGGHAAIRDTLHDGIRLPRAFRKAGFRTDIFDATWLATCRMYHGSIATWQGLLKNAHEGMASNGQLPFWLFVLGLGQVAPLPLFAIGFVSGWPGLAVAMLGLASALCYWPRLLALSRFAHPVDSVLLHPLGIAVLLAIQVHAWGRRTLGLASTWKGRAYGPGTIQS